MHTRRSFLLSSGVMTVVVLTADPATADRSARPRDPDPAALIQGDWIFSTIEHQDVMTSQVPTRAERRLDWVWELRHFPWDRDKSVDIPMPGPGLPRDTPIYRFGGGRLTVWVDSWPVGQGHYRFTTNAGRSVLELTWDKTPDRDVTPSRVRGLCRIGEKELAWCVDAEHVDQVPRRFAATDKEKDAYISTFRRIQ